MDNKVNFSIPDEVIVSVKQNLTDALNSLQPYMIALTPAERQMIPKMGDKTLPLVDKILEYCVSDPRFSPPYLDVEALDGDMKVCNQLTPLFRLVKSLNDGLDDTIMEAGGESYMNALGYYNSVKQAAKMNVPGAKSIYEDLKQRFEKAKTGNVTPPTPVD